MENDQEKNEELLKESPEYEIYEKKFVDTRYCYFSNEPFNGNNLPFACVYCGYKFKRLFNPPENHECPEYTKKHNLKKSPMDHSLEVWTREEMLEKLSKITELSLKLHEWEQLDAEEKLDNINSLKIQLAYLFSKINRPGLALEIVKKFLEENGELTKELEPPENWDEEPDPEWERWFNMNTLWLFQSELYRRLMLIHESRKSALHAVKKMTETSILETPTLDEIRGSVDEEEKFLTSIENEMDDFDKEMLRVLMSNLRDSSEPGDFHRDFMRFTEEHADEIDKRMEKEETMTKKKKRKHDDSPDFYL